MRASCVNSHSLKIGEFAILISLHPLFHLWVRGPVLGLGLFVFRFINWNVSNPKITDPLSIKFHEFASRYVIHSVRLQI